MTHDLPQKVTFFVGQVVTHVSFGGHELILYFDGGASINVTSFVELEVDGHALSIADFVADGAPLLNLVNRVVEAAIAHENDCLELRFDREVILRLMKDEEETDSYVIWHGQEMIAV